MKSETNEITFRSSFRSIRRGIAGVIYCSAMAVWGHKLLSVFILSVSLNIIQLVLYVDKSAQCVNEDNKVTMLELKNDSLRKANIRYYSVPRKEVTKLYSKLGI